MRSIRVCVILDLKESTLNSDITVIRGDDEAVEASIVLDNQPYDLSDCTIWFTVKSSLRDGDEDALFQKTSEVTGGIEIMDAEQGLVSIGISQSDTNNLPVPDNLQNREIIDYFQEFYYDLQVMAPTGGLYTAARGRFLVSFDVTRNNSV